MEARDGAADREDRRLLRGEGAWHLDEIDHDVEQAPVVRQEVAAIGGENGGGEERAPGRAIRPAVDPLRHPGQEIGQQARGRRARLARGTAGEDSRQEARADGLVDAADQPVEGRRGGEVGEQLFVGGERVEGRPQRVERQIEQGLALEAARVEPIADARRPEGALPEESGQSGRVGRGGLELRALHDDDDVLELAEVLGVVLVERGVPLVEREQVELGRLEG